MPPVEVIVPWQDACEDRSRALEWVFDRYRAEHPEWRVTVAPAPDGPWCKGAAVNPVVRADGPEVVIVADADTWTTGLQEAVDKVTTGLAGWAIPHQLVHRLTPEGTRQLLDTGRAPDGMLAQPAYRGVAGGGFVVLPRALAREVPLDQRFTGWGQEDMSWAVALHVLAGPAWRGDHDLIHLWHEPQQRQDRKVGSPQGQRLFRRYIAARNDPALMRALIAEGATT